MACPKNDIDTIAPSSLHHWTPGPFATPASSHFADAALYAHNAIRVFGRAMKMQAMRDWLVFNAAMDSGEIERLARRYLGPRSLFARSRPLRRLLTSILPSANTRSK